MAQNNNITFRKPHMRSEPASGSVSDSDGIDTTPRNNNSAESTLNNSQNLSFDELNQKFIVVTMELDVAHMEIEMLKQENATLKKELSISRKTVELYKNVTLEDFSPRRSPRLKTLNRRTGIIGIPNEGSDDLHREEEESNMSIETECVKMEAEEVLIKEEPEEMEGMCVKEEADSADFCDLYKDYQVKDELVLGTVLIHHPPVYSTHAHRAAPAVARGRACSVRLERLLVDAERRTCRLGRRTYKLRTDTAPTPPHHYTRPNRRYKCAEEERETSLEVKEKEKNVEIVGLEEKDGITLHNAVQMLACSLGVDAGQIREIQRVGVKPADDVSATADQQSEGASSERPRPVLITMATRAARDQWLANMKIASLCNDDVFGNGNKDFIYINEDLTKYTRNLLWTAKKELRLTYKCVWVKNGEVLVRKDTPGNAKIKVVRSLNDIDSLLNGEKGHTYRYISRGSFLS